MGLKIAAPRLVRRSNFLFKVDDWELCNDLAKFNLKADPVKASVTDLAPETVEKTFDYTRDHVASVCLPLTCKRLFFIFDKDYNKVEEARRWNNTSGPWKQKLMLLLAKGEIPQEKMNLCFGCWRFAPSGPSSEQVWKRSK